MTTDIFSRQQFEEALPRHKVSGAPLWRALGLKDGEYAYMVEIGPPAHIEVRSSVDSSGFARGTGEDSIRVWLVGLDGLPLGSKVQTYVTRVPGWQRRLLAVLRVLAKRAKQVEVCDKCGKPKGIFKVRRAGPNKGKLFTKCCDQFKWVSAA